MLLQICDIIFKVSMLILIVFGIFRVSAFAYSFSHIVGAIVFIILAVICGGKILDDF